MSDSLTIVIIGGGAAGFFSAIHNKQTHPQARVILIEKSKQVLAKVKVSGGGRCNVTHACFDSAKLCTFYPRGSKELRGPFQRFQPADTMAWFESHGVTLKTESDNRVFPVSNSSQTIIDCLVNVANELGVKIWTGCSVESIQKEGDGFVLSVGQPAPLTCHKLVLATGSSSKGYVFAKQLGHTIVDPIPSLFTVKIDDANLHALSGLSIDHTEVWVEGHKKSAQEGPLLVTHWGMSGPAIIKLSAWCAELFHDENYAVRLCVNVLPDMSTSDISERLMSTRQNSPKSLLGGQSPFPEIPRRLWRYLVAYAGLNPDAPFDSLAETSLMKLVQTLQCLTFSVTGKGVFKEEFVTCGGVLCKEINFKTMESKRCPGLHIVGELLNIDGVTGGFNFQNAWTTGYLSGAS